MVNHYKLAYIERESGNGNSSKFMDGEEDDIPPGKSSVSLISSTHLSGRHLKQIRDSVSPGVS